MLIQMHALSNRFVRASVNRDLCDVHSAIHVAKEKPFHFSLTRNSS